jgi:hypothetical protein
MLALTNATKRDSGIMRLIAVITMVYLPGTFMAVSSLHPSQNSRGYPLMELVDPVQYRFCESGVFVDTGPRHRRQRRGHLYWSHGSIDGIHPGWGVSLGQAGEAKTG